MLLIAPRPRPPVLVLRAAAKSYRAGVPGCAASVRVLADVDLVVGWGDRVAVLADRGAGRTTLLLLAAGLLVPDLGGAWRLPGGRLGRGALGEWLAWNRGPGPASALVAPPCGAPPPPWATRAVRLVGGRLTAVELAPRALRVAGRPPPRDCRGDRSVAR